MAVNLFVGVASGIISGLLVSLFIALYNLYRKPPIELIHVAEARAVLKNNRPRSLVVGGSWMFEAGSVLFRPDGFRGGEGGFFVPPLGEFVVGTMYFAPGQTADIVFKYVKKPRTTEGVIRLEENSQPDASEIALCPDQYPDWKVKRVTLKGFA